MLYVLTLFMTLSLALPVHAAAIDAADATGTLVFERPDSAGNGYGPVVTYCSGVLVAPDVVLTQASCFDAMHATYDTVQQNDVVITFRPTQPGGAPGIAASGFALHPGYVPIDCTLERDKQVCAQAVRYCARRFIGMKRNVCIANAALYARTYVAKPSHDVAVVFLSRALAMPVAGVVEDADASLAACETMAFMRPGTADEPLSPLRRDAFAFVAPHTPQMSTGGFAAVRPENNTAGLVGVTSHFLVLPYTDDVPLSYVFTRLDAALDWLDGAMNQAYADGKRIKSGGVRRIKWPPPARDPAPQPEPKPVPEPNPQPVPSPTPAPTPAPRPAPRPTPAPNPQPLPEPSPAPQPQPPAVPAPPKAPRVRPEPPPPEVPGEQPFDPGEPNTPQPPSRLPGADGNPDGGGRAPSHDGVHVAPQGCRGGASEMVGLLLFPVLRRRWRRQV
jgi:hypothetical protein